MFCVAAKHGKGRTNLTKPLQMYIKFFNYAPKKIIFNINSTKISCVFDCILVYYMSISDIIAVTEIYT